MASIAVLVLIGSLVVTGAVQAATGGRIDLYSDAALSACSLTDTEPGIASVYVVHRIAGFPVVVDGTVGILFRLVSSTGFTGTWIDDVFPAGMIPSGTSQSSIAVAYGGLCMRSDVLVLQARYQMQGASPPCAFVETAPYRDYFAILASPCGLDPLPVDGEHIYVNPDASCPCDVPPVATDSSTWGRVKALYRN
jgi:hypothetical protein